VRGRRVAWRRRGWCATRNHYPSPTRTVRRQLIIVDLGTGAADRPRPPLCRSGPRSPRKAGINPESRLSGMSLKPASAPPSMRPTPAVPSLLAPITNSASAYRQPSSAVAAVLHSPSLSGQDSYLRPRVCGFQWAALIAHLGGSDGAVRGGFA
jgi:hypothetical protein